MGNIKVSRLLKCCLCFTLNKSFQVKPQKKMSSCLYFTNATYFTATNSTLKSNKLYLNLHVVYIHHSDQSLPLTLLTF